MPSTTLVDDLLDNAYQDTQLLLENQRLGDVLSNPRDVEFVLTAHDEARARTVCSFIEDNAYGSATVRAHDGSFDVVVVVHMPVTQNIACSVSGLMCCIAALFSVEYDGWSSALQKGR